MKSERHHWWPRALSKRWEDESGCVHWILPSGELRRVPSKELGAIRNGHHLKLSKTPGVSTPWDESFEHEFQSADNGLNSIVNWLEGLRYEPLLDLPLQQRFVPEHADEGMVASLMEALVSLVVRSPKNRETAVSLAEHFRGPLPQAERNALIALNIRRSQQTIAGALGTSGKFVAIFSPQREFVFGDGFFHNLCAEPAAMHFPKMLVPLTPRISVLFVRPTRYLTNPKMMTLVASADEVNNLNTVIQVYSKTSLYFRSEQPELTDHYRAAAHRRFRSNRNPVDLIINSIPGVERRHTYLDKLFPD